MRLISCEALVLDVRELQERDRIVALLCAEHGHKQGVARGARTKYSRFAGQLQPLSKVAVTWFEKDSSDLVRIREVSLVRSAAKLYEDLEGILLGSYLAEHLLKFTVDGEPAPTLYRLLDSTVEALLGGCDRPLAARYLEIWTLRLTGIFPSPTECPLCGAALLERAVLIGDDLGLVCSSCADSGVSGEEGEAMSGRFVVGEGVLELLRRSGRENLASLAADPPTVAVLGRTERLCARVRRAFLQDELKSYRVMRQTLGTDSEMGGAA